MNPLTEQETISTLSANGAPPPAPPDGRAHRGGFIGWIRRRPFAALMIAAVVGLLVGGGIVAAAGLAPLQGDLDNARADLNATEGELGETEDLLGDSEAEVAALEDDLASAKASIVRLTKEGEVPDFTGRTIGQAEDLSRPFDWQLSVSKAPSDAPEGTIIAQSVTEGTELGRGRSIALTVAIPAPPEWTSFQSFSGSGSTKTDEFEIPPGKVRMVYSMNGATNQIVDLIKPGNLLAGDLLVNEIGSVSGETRVYVNSGAYYLDISGGSSWSVDLQVLE